MKVAVVGYGKMGREVAAALKERNHEPIISLHGANFPAGCAVGIDFTQADVVLENTQAALRSKARYVIGTTGWSAQADQLKRLVAELKGGVVHGANFSLGMNLFGKVVREAARLFAHFPDYDPYVLERHHRQKKDAPSGTALILARMVETSGGRRRHAATTLDGALADDRFHVSSVRAGGIVGDHTVGFDSGGDEILLEHRARSRHGFALGAVLAAEWIAGREGLHTFEEVVDDLALRRGAGGGA